MGIINFFLNMGTTYANEAVEMDINISVISVIVILFFGSLFVTYIGVSNLQDRYLMTSDDYAIFYIGNTIGRVLKCAIGACILLIALFFLYSNF